MMTTTERRPQTDGQVLWEAWYRAGFDQGGTDQARAEDALFRHYLPLARELARRGVPDGEPDGGGAIQAAEIALARAILDWREPDGHRFESFARLAIKRELSSFLWRYRPRAGRTAHAGQAR